jgi:signal transduction histidine kinase
MRGITKRSAQRAEEIGRAALAEGLETVDLAYMHGEALLALMPTVAEASRDVSTERAATFFLAVLAPIERTRTEMVKTVSELKLANTALRQRSTDLTAANRQLTLEVTQRRLVEKTLRASERNYRTLLTEARQMQRQLRHLSHQVLMAQEEERKEISRELHDEIVQTLTGINVHLASLKLESGDSRKSIARHIDSTQRLVEKSVDIVHQFARDLRPTLLDDLGLIPALHAYLKAFNKRTGLKVGFTTFVGVEHMSNDKRTVLYRVAQAALVNISQHAKASTASVAIKRLPDAVLMEIRDDGRAFDAERVLDSRRNKRLGLIGMRERVEMVGGTFSVESVKGRGTIISALLPFKHSLTP